MISITIYVAAKKKRILTFEKLEPMTFRLSVDPLHLHLFVKKKIIIVTLTNK